MARTSEYTLNEVLDFIHKQVNKSYMGSEMNMVLSANRLIEYLKNNESEKVFGKDTIDYILEEPEECKYKVGDKVYIIEWLSDSDEFVITETRIKDVRSYLSGVGRTKISYDIRLRRPISYKSYYRESVFFDSFCEADAFLNSEDGNKHKNDLKVGYVRWRELLHKYKKGKFIPHACSPYLFPKYSKKHKTYIVGDDE